MRHVAWGLAILAAVLVGGPVARVSAQAAVTNTDIQRLQDDAYEAGRDISSLRNRDAVRANQLQGDLDDARDETVYLKVKLRKAEPVSRREYAELRDRIDAIRSRARGEAVGRQAPPAAAPPAAVAPQPPTVAVPANAAPAAQAQRPAPPAPSSLPVGTEFDARLQTSLSSETAQVEDRFEATTAADVRNGGRVVVPAGSLLRGVVSAVNKAGRVDRKSSLTVVFDQVTVDGKSYPIRATVLETIENSTGGEVGKVGAGAGIGAILGGILGGAKGAVAGILIGAGGTMAATEGKNVDLPPGTVLRVRLDSSLSLR